MEAAGAGIERVENLCGNKCIEKRFGLRCVTVKSRSGEEERKVMI